MRHDVCSGRDARKLLQGLITNDMNRLSKPCDALYAAFLSAKGRTLFEALIAFSSTVDAPISPQIMATASHGKAAAPLGKVDTFFLDVDAATLPQLVRHLNRFKLAFSVSVADASDTHAVLALLPKRPFLSPLHGVQKGVGKGADGITREEDTLSPPPPPLALQRTSPSDESSIMTFLDPRTSPAVGGLRELGYRVFLGTGRRREGGDAADSRTAAVGTLASALSAPAGSLSISGVTEYHALRCLLGVPEGTSEVQDLVPLEWNAAELGAIAFDKGCYVGQEIVARTHFRGKVHKRLLPTLFSDADEGPSEVRSISFIAADAPTSAGGAEAAARTTDRIHKDAISVLDLPFSFIDLQLPSGSTHGSVPKGSTILPFSSTDGTTAAALQQGTTRRELEEAPSSSTSPNTISSTARVRSVGKTVSTIPGTNLGLSLFRVEHLRHCLLPPPPAAAAASNSDYFDEPVVSDAQLLQTMTRELMDIHARCKSQSVHFIAKEESEIETATGDAVTQQTPLNALGKNARTLATLTPLLPPFWRKIPHAVQEE